MDKRFLAFVVLATTFYIANAWLVQKMNPPPENPPVAEKPADPAAKPEAAKPDAANPAAGAAGAPAPAAAGNDPAAPANPAAPAAPVNKFDPQRVTLGSLADDPKQRMLVTFFNRGAVVERVELNNPRYHDVDNLRPLGGYLGHLAEEATAGNVGVKVNVVGPGTPAATAGIQVGDVITNIDDRATTTIAEYRRALRESKPGGQAKVKIVRGAAAPQELTVDLRRHPLEVIRPEASNPVLPDDFDPASLVMTLQQFDNQTLSLEGDQRDLAGVDLSSAYWEVLPGNPQEPNAVAFRHVVPAPFNVEVVKRFRLLPITDQNVTDDTAQAYTLGMTIEVKNVDDKAHRIAYRLDGPTGLPTEGFWYSKDSKIGLGSNPGMRDVIYGRYNGQKVEHGMITCTQIVDKDPGATAITDDPIHYAGVDSQYFAAVVMPQLAQPNDELFSRLMPVQIGAAQPDKEKKLTDVSFRFISTGEETQPGGTSHTHEYKIFFGPKVPRILAEYGLDAQIDYGWYDWIAVAMLWILHSFYKIVGNYGIAIILLTVVVRLAMFPLSRKQALNAAKMQELQPEIKKIAEKYKTKPDEKLKAQQELFKKHNYSIAGGCLPVFIQLPIFVGLYNSLKVDVELRQAPLINENIRWASNLSAPDMFWHWQPFMPKFLAGEDGFLGPFLNLLPCITIGLFLLQQKLFMPPATDEQSAMQQKIMKYMMIFMGVMFFKVPTGLCVYFITSSIWSIAERQLLPKAKPAPISGATLDVTPVRPVAATPDKKSKR